MAKAPRCSPLSSGSPEKMKEINFEEIKLADNETFKVFLRPPKDRPLTQMQLKAIFEQLKHSKIIYVPDGTEFVVVRKGGKVKVY